MPICLNQCKLRCLNSPGTQLNIPNLPLIKSNVIIFRTLFEHINLKIIYICGLFFKSALGLEEKIKNFFAENASMRYFKTFWSVHF